MAVCNEQGACVKLAKRVSCPKPDRDTAEHYGNSEPTYCVDCQTYLEIVERVRCDENNDVDEDRYANEFFTTLVELSSRKVLAPSLTLRNGEMRDQDAVRNEYRVYRTARFPFTLNEPLCFCCFFFSDFANSKLLT
jgi:hypothetical protein